MKFNWKTTLCGIGTILLAIAQLNLDNLSNIDPKIIVEIIAGIGLIFAADGKPKEK